MTESGMSVLTGESIVALRGVAHANPKDVWESDLSDLVDRHSLSMVEVDVVYERGHEFKVGAARDLSKDMGNAVLLRKALPGLTPSQATDERIWTTLALGAYKEYVLRRWDTGVGNDVPVDLKIFVAGTRALVRDHSIARLWWRAHFASVVPRAKVADPLALFFQYEDIPGEVMGRSITTNLTVLTAYLSHLEKILPQFDGQSDLPGDFKKKYIQGFGKQLNFLAGRFQLGMLGEDRLSELFSVAHHEAEKRARKKELAS
jgi:hypothetical protein